MGKGIGVSVSLGEGVQCEGMGHYTTHRHQE